MACTVVNVGVAVKVGISVGIGVGVRVDVALGTVVSVGVKLGVTVVAGNAGAAWLFFAELTGRVACSPTIRVTVAVSSSGRVVIAGTVAGGSATQPPETSISSHAVSNPTV